MEVLSTDVQNIKYDEPHSIFNPDVLPVGSVFVLASSNYSTAWGTAFSITVILIYFNHYKLYFNVINVTVFLNLEAVFG